jgi:hypothetical protein
MMNISYDLDPVAQLLEEDRRREDRSRLIIDLFFEGSDATGVASTRDISVGGLYMNTLAFLPEGAYVVLRVLLGGVQVVLKARVVYSNPGHGVGVHFYDMSEETREVLERAVSS